MSAVARAVPPPLLFEAAARMRDANKGVQLQDRSNGPLKTYRKCCTGTEIVDWLVANKIVITRQLSVDWGQAMISNGLLVHVSQEMGFVDKKELYFFISPVFFLQDQQVRELSIRMNNLVNGPPMQATVKRNFKTFKDCVVARELVDWIFREFEQSFGLADRNDALALAASMALWRMSDNLTEPHERFQDDDNLWELHDNVEQAVTEMRNSLQNFLYIYFGITQETPALGYYSCAILWKGSVERGFLVITARNIAFRARNFISQFTHCVSTDDILETSVQGQQGQYRELLMLNMSTHKLYFTDWLAGGREACLEVLNRACSHLAPKEPIPLAQSDALSNAVRANIKGEIVAQPKSPFKPGAAFPPPALNKEPPINNLADDPFEREADMYATLPPVRPPATGTSPPARTSIASRAGRSKDDSASVRSRRAATESTNLHRKAAAKATAAVRSRQGSGRNSAEGEKASRPSRDDASGSDSPASATVLPLPKEVLASPPAPTKPIDAWTAATAATSSGADVNSPGGGNSSEPATPEPVRAATTSNTPSGVRRALQFENGPTTTGAPPGSAPIAIASLNVVGAGSASAPTLIAGSPMGYATMPPPETENAANGGSNGVANGGEASTPALPSAVPADVTTTATTTTSTTTGGTSDAAGLNSSAVQIDVNAGQTQQPPATVLSTSASGRPKVPPLDLHNIVVPDPVSTGAPTKPPSEKSEGSTPTGVVAGKKITRPKPLRRQVSRDSDGFSIRTGTDNTGPSNDDGDTSASGNTSALDSDTGDGFDIVDLPRGNINESRDERTYEPRRRRTTTTSKRRRTKTDATKVKDAEAERKKQEVRERLSSNVSRSQNPMFLRVTPPAETRIVLDAKRNLRMANSLPIMPHLRLTEHPEVELKSSVTATIYVDVPQSVEIHTAVAAMMICTVTAQFKLAYHDTYYSPCTFSPHNPIMCPYTARVVFQHVSDEAAAAALVAAAAAAAAVPGAGKASSSSAAQQTSETAPLLSKAALATPSASAASPGFTAQDQRLSRAILYCHDYCDVCGQMNYMCTDPTVFPRLVNAIAADREANSGGNRAMLLTDEVASHSLCDGCCKGSCTIL